MVTREPAPLQMTADSCAMPEIGHTSLVYWYLKNPQAGITADWNTLASHHYERRAAEGCRASRAPETRAPPTCPRVAHGPRRPVRLQPALVSRLNRTTPDQ